MSYKKKDTTLAATPSMPAQPTAPVKPAQPAEPTESLTTPPFLSQADLSTPPFLSQRFLFKIGATIKLFYTFLENVNGNQFLSDAYYYYNVVSHSERGFECVQAKACHARIIDTYYSKGMIADSNDARKISPNVMIKDSSSDDSTLRPVTHMELMKAFGYDVKGERSAANAANAASETSAANGANGASQQDFVFEFLPPNLSNFSAAPRSSSKFNGIQEFLSGMKILKMTMKTISLFKIENWLKI